MSVLTGRPGCAGSDCYNSLFIRINSTRCMLLPDVTGTDRTTRLSTVDLGAEHVGETPTYDNVPHTASFYADGVEVRCMNS